MQEICLKGRDPDNNDLAGVDLEGVDLEGVEQVFEIPSLKEILNDLIPK